MKFNYPSIYYSLNMKEKEVLESVLKLLYNTDNALSLIWGGSTTIQITKQPWTDIDLWLVMKEKSKIKQQLYSDFKHIDNLSLIYDAGFLPWLGDLISLFFFQDCTFSIDLGICDLEGLSSANPGPKPYFVWGQSAKISNRLKHQKYLSSPQQRLMKILVNLLKIRKCLVRRHIWNSIEYLSRARRELMGLIVKRSDPNAIYYIRSDRNIEDLIDEKYIKKLGKTCPQYSITSVVKCTSLIIHFCLDLIEKENIDKLMIQEFANLHDWFYKFNENHRKVLV